MKRHQFFFFALLAISIFLTGCKNDTLNNGQDTNNPPPTNDSTKLLNEPDTAGIDEDYNDTQRMVWQKPEVVINLLGDLEDKTVADIGAGTGFFSLRLAQKAKKVIAIDIDPRFIQYLDSAKIWELPEMYQSRLESRLAQPRDPKLKAGEADVAIIVNTYIYIPDRVNYVKNLKKGLSDRGQLLIVDFKKKRTQVGPPQSLRIPLFQVEEELYKAGYRNVRTYDTMLDYQYVVIAEK